MPIHVRHNGSTYTLGHCRRDNWDSGVNLDFIRETKLTTPALCYRENGTTHYVPLVKDGSSCEIGYYTLTYEDSPYYPRFHVMYNGAIYHVPNKAVEKSKYDIPAGTYSPSAFAALIANYISLNGSRKCANEFTAKVNNQTITVAANSTIYYLHEGYGGASVDKVSFGEVYNVYSSVSIFHNTSSGFKNYKQYVVNNVGYYFEQYANYPITIGTGIKFA